MGVGSGRWEGGGGGKKEREQGREKEGGRWGRGGVKEKWKVEGRREKGVNNWSSVRKYTVACLC